MKLLRRPPPPCCHYYDGRLPDGEEQRIEIQRKLERQKNKEVLNILDSKGGI